MYSDDIEGASELELLVPAQINQPWFFEGGHDAGSVGGCVDTTAKGGVDCFAKKTDAKDMPTPLTDGQGARIGGLGDDGGLTPLEKTAVDDGVCSPRPVFFVTRGSNQYAARQ